ncbi:WYL domain-containing protein [Ruminococcus sp. XPD3002]|uniref:WYL domain-containing protein n=1 Tax=Ruminococcus sp. XPD3002 TaxID=1452269 RepID=UPI0009210AAA|nr:WYL domain-containing protein [Ruminococcus flavefaciens]
MELFNEYRNKSLRAFLKLAERISYGEELSIDEFEAEYYRLSGDNKKITSVFYKNTLYNDKLPIFDTREGKVRLFGEPDKCSNKHISDTLLKSEITWLHNALNDKLSKLFLSDEERISIDAKLSDYTEYYKNIDDMWRSNEDISEEVEKNFKIILKAINEKQALSYTFKNKNCEGFPVRIEYDERTCRIYMIIYDGNRFVKSDISKLSDIYITENSIDTIPEIKDDMLNKKAYLPVVFTVTDDKNRKAIDRALLAFSVYDHVVEPIDEKTARFTIQYYTMDLDLLIKDILAFGSDIKVESPRYVVKRITDILRKV